MNSASTKIVGLTSPKLDTERPPFVWPSQDQVLAIRTALADHTKARIDVLEGPKAVNPMGFGICRFVLNGGGRMTLPPYGRTSLIGTDCTFLLAEKGALFVMPASDYAAIHTRINSERRESPLKEGIALTLLAVTIDTRTVDNAGRITLGERLGGEVTEGHPASFDIISRGWYWEVWKPSALEEQIQKGRNLLAPPERLSSLILPPRFEREESHKIQPTMKYSL